MYRNITEPEFDEALTSFKRSAFRWEAQDAYALSYEAAEYLRFLSGSPTPPPELDWWRPWLEQIARLKREGKTVSRVRVLAEPPSDYQRWMMWAAPWAAAAGEEIRYMPHSRARGLGMTQLAEDWWLLDDEQVIIMWFTEAGEIDGKIITDEPGIVARHLHWRDLAVRNATPAEEYAAA